MAAKEPEHVRQTRALRQAMNRATDTADESLRRVMVCMLALGYRPKHLQHIATALQELGNNVEMLERDDWAEEIVPGVLP